MPKQESNFSYQGMAFLFKIRDFFRPRKDILKEVGIKPGFQVLDYGCGPGGYIIPTTKLIGETGKVFALDINPLAIQMVQSLISKNHLKNVATIQSDCNTGLSDNSLDVVLLYDIFHLLGKPDEILREVYRVLKPDGTLSFSDHHMKKEEMLSKVTSQGLFKLLKKGRRTYSFGKSY
jgi:ubiquinone/menaquinone biosynthesis C-methylase UbiE